MRHVKAKRPGAASITALALGAALAGATLLNPMAMSVVRAQSEPITAANGVLLPPPDYDPAAARNELLTASAVLPATATPPADAADASATTEAPASDASAPATAADPSVDGSSVTTSLGGSDVAVSSVGGSHEVDRPKKRSERRN